MGYWFGIIVVCSVFGVLLFDCLLGFIYMILQLGLFALCCIGWFTGFGVWMVVLVVVMVLIACGYLGCSCWYLVGYCEVVFVDCYFAFGLHIDVTCWLVLVGLLWWSVLLVELDLCMLGCVCGGCFDFSGLWLLCV